MEHHLNHVNTAISSQAISNVNTSEPRDLSLQEKAKTREEQLDSREIRHRSVEVDNACNNE